MTLRMSDGGIRRNSSGTLTFAVKKVVLVCLPRCLGRGRKGVALQTNESNGHDKLPAKTMGYRKRSGQQMVVNKASVLWRMMTSKYGADSPR